MFIAFLPRRFSKIRGYAQRVVIVREAMVQTIVRNAVHTKALMYLGSLRTVEYALKLKPLGKR